MEGYAIGPKMDRKWTENEIEVEVKRKREWKDINCNKK